jgi:hypothetical protein
MVKTRTKSNKRSRSGQWLSRTAAFIDIEPARNRRSDGAFSTTHDRSQSKSRTGVVIA